MRALPDAKGADPMVAEQGSPSDATGIATPRGGDGALSALLRSQGFLAFGARLAWWLTSLAGGPLRLGSNVIAVRHGDVSAVLARDLDFLIAPVNAARIEAVNGPFVLGMDRCATLAKEREALYSALRQVDRAKLKDDVDERARRAIAGAADGTLDVVGSFARPIAASTARSLFGLTGQDDILFMDVARAIFAHTFLNIGGDKTIEARALKAAVLMRRWFEVEIERRRSNGQLGTDMMGALLRDGLLDDDGVRRTLGGMLVGSIDTTATAVAKIIAILGQDPKLRKQIYADRNDSAKLSMWCLEALRRWPHNPLVLRRASVDTVLSGTDVKAGDTVVAFTQAAMLDPDVFPEPNLLKPDRPLSAYLHYGGGLHPCAGRAINDFQITTLVRQLLERDIDSTGRIIWAGPFPDQLIVRFSRKPA
jgi:cytochrome P450